MTHKSLAVLLLLAAILQVGMAPVASGQQVTVQEIIKHIQSNRTSLPAFKSTYKHSEVTTNSQSSFQNRVDVLVVKQDKMYLKFTDKRGSENIEIFDGTKRISVYTPANNPERKSQVSSGTDIPFGFIILRFGYMFGNTWMDEHLNKSVFHHAGTENDPTFGIVHHIVSHENHVEQHHYLAPKYGWLIVRSVYNDDRSPNRFFYKVNKVEQHKDHWFPVSGTMKYGDKNTNGNPARYQVDITDAKYEFAPIDDRLFKLNVSKGSLIRNEGKTYRVGSDKSLQQLVDRSNSQPQNQVDLWGWLFTPSVAILLALTVIAYVRWKRKQWAKRSEASKSPSES